MGALDDIRTLRDLATGKSYSDVNVLPLIGAYVDRGFDPNEWLTFSQVKALGGSVKKGAKAVTGIFHKFVEHEIENKNNHDQMSYKVLYFSSNKVAASLLRARKEKKWLLYWMICSTTVG